ncbi:MAG: tripartite tricarboxylate transporter TctB family protein [Burkholderiales bacterium]
MHSKASLALSLFILAVSGWGIVSALSWPWKAALFPLVISIPLACLAAAEVVWVFLGAVAKNDAADFKLSDHLPREVTLRRTAIALGWILGFFAAILLAGFPVAVPLFVFLYLRIQGREGWVFSVIFTLVVWALFYALFDQLLHLHFPAGWILTWLG